jgi:tetratricopeptide (TPR) repeat protein
MGRALPRVLGRSAGFAVALHGATFPREGEADELYREAVAFDRVRPAGSPTFVTDGVHYLAWAEHRKGDLAEAEADYRRALGLYRRQLPVGHPYRAAAATGLGEVLREEGRSAEAARYLQEGQARLSWHADQ